ncbi:type 4a pilus biogenesis protein PilO [Trinickia sp. LjRoot230]|uniref:type 4a pilus biogenesis protein PilO n=1 Tax=Trinickia sp. LjRoot230 TaxID=3342288 RepID=UPI003ECD470C
MSRRLSSASRPGWLRGGLAGVASERAGRLGGWFAVWFSAPHAWSGAHRLLSAVALSAVAFAVCTHGWRVAGLAGSGADDSRVTFAELERRVADARSKVASLPALRRSVQSEHALAASAASGARATTAGHWQAISALAARSGMTLRSLEPGTQSGGGAEASRPVRLTAQTTFAAFVSFLQGVATLPSLVVPTEIRLQPAPDGLTLEATLDVFEALPAAPRATSNSPAERDDGEVWLGDPFDGTRLAARSGIPALDLVGLMLEETRGLALFDASGRGEIYLPGQLIAGQRLLRVDAHGVTLASGGGTKVILLGSPGSADGTSDLTKGGA